MVASICENTEKPIAIVEVLEVEPDVVPLDTNIVDPKKIFPIKGGDEGDRLYDRIEILLLSKKNQRPAWLTVSLFF